MKRHWVYALAALFALPCAARAQGDPGWGPVLRITPFVGVSPGITQEGVAEVFTDAGFSTHEYKFEYGSSVSFGANAEYRFWNRFGIVAGGIWSSRGKGRLIDFEDETIRNHDGATLWMAKAGLSMRLIERKPELQLHRLNASIFAAPAIIHDVPKTDVLTPTASKKAINHWGLNLGAEAELPLTNQGLAFQLGFEDWIILWDEENFSSRIQGYYQELDPSAGVAIDADNTHLVMFRAGLTWRF